MLFNDQEKEEDLGSVLDSILKDGKEVQEKLSALRDRVADLQSELEWLRLPIEKRKKGLKK